MTRCLRSSSCWVPPRLLHHLPWVLPGQLCFCVWARQAEKHFGSAPCLSRVQHYQGSRLVSSISRCLSLLRSQVSSQDFLAQGETECLSEPSRPVFHLQQPGSCLGDGPGPPGQPIPFCSAQEALCISFLALQSKEAPGFHPSPAPWVYCSPRTGSEVALPSKSEQFLHACLQRQECQPRRARPLTVSKSNWDLFRTWSSPARQFQLFALSHRLGKAAKVWKQTNSGSLQNIRPGLAGASPSPCLGTLSANSRSLPAFQFIWGGGPEGAAWPWVHAPGKREQAVDRVTLYPWQGAPGLPAHAEKGSWSQGCRLQEPTRGASCSGHGFRSKELRGPPNVLVTIGNPHLSILGV